MLSQPATHLRLTDRKALLRHLKQLSAINPERRAQAALDASDLLHRKGVDWEALIPLERGNDQPASDWPAPAMDLLADPRLTVEERTYIKKVSAWRAPGAACLAQLRAIASRLNA